MAKRLPAQVEAAIDSLGALGSQTQRLVRGALERLIFDACIERPGDEVFVQTGDIEAMWIRDSCWQLRPLVRFAADEDIAWLLVGAVKAQVRYLGIDPYANAFNIEANGACWHKDFVDQSPWVFERKFELDSLTAFLHFSLDLVDAGVREHIDGAWWRVVRDVVDLMQRETQHDVASYRFVRANAPAHDYLSNDGYGAKFAESGLIWSAFRPSDDACELPFSIAANLHAVVVLQRLTTYCDSIGVEAELAAQARALAESVEAAVQKHGVIERASKQLYAYEVDGLGTAIMQDDANYPNLVSLPWLGHASESLYLATREFALSADNPWYFESPVAAGIGSPHTGSQMVWPLAIAMAGLTAATAADQLAALRMIEATASADGHIHESFKVDKPEVFTRPWFSWAEMTYVELALKVLENQA